MKYRETDSEKNAKAMVGSLNPLHDTFEEVVSRMRLLGDQLLTSQNINFVFCLDGDPSQCHLATDRPDDFYFIYKESLTNIAEHSKCMNVMANLSIKNDAITLTITDDGIGFNTNMINGNGLHNMKTRSRNLNGQISIWSGINKGSKMELAIPHNLDTI